MPRSLGAMPEAARFWAEAVRCDPEAVGPRLELAEAFGWLGQDADFEREWQAALQRLPAEGQSVAWNRRGKVLGMIMCNLRAGLAAYQQAVELLPADAPRLLRVEILLGAAWCESVAGALRAADAAVAATRGIPVIEVRCLAGRAFVLSRLGRHDEALSLAAEQLAKAERMDSPEAAALARHDAGLISLAAGHYAEAARMLAEALAEGAEVSRPAARLARAEALARSGHPDDAAAELRRAALEPVRDTDLPWALVPRMARVQGLIALARGDHALARRRLGEAADSWQRHLRHDAGTEFMATVVDLARPPIVGLVEPEWELRRLTTELAELDELTEVS
jgi:tetratricopeptide (TPR) repeat protein